MADEAQRALEALVMVADEPVEVQLLAQLLEISVARVDELCAELAAEYEAQERGFQLVKVAGGYRYQSHPREAAYVERFALEGQSARMSAAALETLAVVAYKQPVSRAQVSAIRGVNVDGVMRTLTQRGYIDEVSRDQGPGQAIMYGTTKLFLEKLGLDSLDDLPPLAQFIPGADVVETLEQGLRVTEDLPVEVDDANDETDAPGHDRHTADAFATESTEPAATEPVSPSARCSSSSSAASGPTQPPSRTQPNPMRTALPCRHDRTSIRSCFRSSIPTSDPTTRSDRQRSGSRGGSAPENPRGRGIRQPSPL